MEAPLHGILVAVLLDGPVAMHDRGMMLLLWALLGLDNGPVLMPSRRRLRRLSDVQDGPARFPIMMKVYA
jgi:hypothetical protein